MLILLGFAALPARADEVAAYLERHGLTRLLAVHLEDQLAGRSGEERDALVLKLVEIYADLLESTDDPQLLRDLEARGRVLLAAASGDVGEELRLALLRGSYRAAERIAEDHRLRQSSPEDLQRARDTLTDIIPKLVRLESQVDNRLVVTERKLMRAGGADASVLAQRAEELQQLSTQCRFLAAWALYYQSWLNDRPENARVAIEHFAALLTVDSSHPQPEEIPEDLRSLESMARCILGTALCRSLTASSVTALAWLDLLEHPQTWEPMREQVPAWRLVIHLEHGEFRAARSLLSSYPGDAAPLAWLRLAAVHALEAQQQDREAAELARLALTRIAAAGELQAVLELADRYGTAALGDSGFAFRYVRGVQHYDTARRSHGAEQPAADAELSALYQQAVDEFEAALGEPDAEQYPDASASCRWLIGWCRFFQGRYLEARDAFALAAERLGPEQGEESMWMAVVCTDRAMSAKEPELAAEQAALIEEMLARYPAGKYTAKLRLKRAMGREPSPEVVEELLAIGPDSDVYDAAREHAARLLYRLFRGASGDQRLVFGNEYLTVAQPLLSAAYENLDDIEDVEAYLARSRRVLEVALSEGIDRLTAAARVLDSLDGLDVSAHADEIDCRRVQERLLAEDPAAAEAIADPLWARSADTIWAQLAERTLFSYAYQRWRAAGGADRLYLDLVVRHGRRVLREFEGEPMTGTVLATNAVVAEALMRTWEATAERGAAAEALSLYERLLEAAPTDARFLRATAMLSVFMDKIEQGLACWRTLLAGSTQGSERWYEAKFNVISILATTDPDRARAVMEQHRQLNPDYGPEPWGSRLRRLDERLSHSGSGSAAGGDSEAGGSAGDAP